MKTNKSDHPQSKNNSGSKGLKNSSVGPTVLLQTSTLLRSMQVTRMPCSSRSHLSYTALTESYVVKIHSCGHFSSQIRSNSTRPGIQSRLQGLKPATEQQPIGVQLCWSVNCLERHWATQFRFRQVTSLMSGARDWLFGSW